MMKVGAALSRITGRTGLKIRKYSPEILLGVGIVGGITAAVMACRATGSDKFQTIRIRHYGDLDAIQDAVRIGKEHPTTLDDAGNEIETYSKMDECVDKIGVYKRTIFGLCQVYGPSLAVGAASIACIVGGHRILKGRNLALMAAYKVVDTAFREYRARVREALGSDADKQFMYNTETKTVTKIDIDEEGKAVKSKMTYQVLKGETVSMYARIFNEETSSQWAREPSFNWLFIKKKLDYLNDRLHATGHVFLNEAYDELGMKHTQAGAVVGWVRNSTGDNYISFGPWCESLMKVENDVENTILLDFNVDGVIWDLI